jgi:hypothetical protein
VAAFFEHENESFGSTKGGKFGRMNYLRLPKRILLHGINQSSKQAITNYNLLLQFGEYRYLVQQDEVFPASITNLAQISLRNS